MSKNFYAVIGNPLAHSQSPVIHQLFAKQTKQPLNYCKQLVEIGHFAETIDQLRDQGLKGVNVTAPFKLEALQYADHADEIAQQVGAASAMKFNDNGISLAVNYDGSALVRDITDNLGWRLHTKRIIILGAGGAARGILQPILLQQPTSLILVNRTVAKAQQLAKTFAQFGEIQAIGYEKLITKSVDIIINATSASLTQQVPLLSPQIIHNYTQCYDLAYSNKPTAFLQWAKQQGCQQLSDGMGMLVEHNAQCFNWWFGVRPKTRPVIRQLRAFTQ